MNNHCGAVHYRDVLEALMHLGHHGHGRNDLAIVERWIRHTERYVQELEDVNRMYKVITDTQKRLLENKFKIPDIAISILGDCDLHV